MVILWGLVSLMSEVPLQVEESWGQIAGRIDEIGVAFFLKVFEIAPEALQLFSFRDVNP